LKRSGTISHGALFSLIALLSFLMGGSSCLRDMPEDFPMYLEWNPSLAAPLAEESFGLNEESGLDPALLDTSIITGLPEWVSRVEVTMEGSVDFDLESFVSRFNELRRLMFRVNLYNGFPNDLDVQVYFQDPGSGAVDSLFSDGHLRVPPGSPVGNGETIEPYYTRKDAVFDEARLQHLEDASTIRFEAILRNPDVDLDLVPFYTDYRFTVEIGVMADLAFDFVY
jgi:hypothetical protein